MHAASRAALRELRKRLETVTGQAAGSDELTELARQLTAVAELLAGQPRLRRAIADPSTESERRADLVARLLTGKISANSLQLVREAAALRWSAPWDLPDALELVADDALLVAAENSGVLDRGRGRAVPVRADPGRQLRAVGAAGRGRPCRPTAGSACSTRWSAARCTRSPVQLLEHAIASRRQRAVTFAIDDLLDAAAQRRERSVAKVVSAVELTAEQQSRLTEALTELYRRPISVRIAVEPAVRGGLVVRIGDEVIDGSVAARLTQVRRALAG